MKKYDGLFRGSPSLARFGLSDSILKKVRGMRMWNNNGTIFTMKAVNDPEIGGVEFHVLAINGRVLEDSHYATINFNDVVPIPEDEAAVIEVMLM